MATKNIELSEVARSLPGVLASEQVCFIVERGRARAALLPIEQYHAMMDAVEELDFLRNASGERRVVHSIVRG